MVIWKVGEKMNKKTLGGLLLSIAIMSGGFAPPAMALDYEAKPINWCLWAPLRTAGGLAGGAVSGLISGPIDGGYHGSLKGTKHVAGKFGDEKGLGQTVAAVPIGGTAGLLVGGTVGGVNGFSHGWKKGWEKPFSRWSFITMEER